MAKLTQYKKFWKPYIKIPRFNFQIDKNQNVSYYTVLARGMKKQVFPYVPSENVIYTPSREDNLARPKLHM